MYSPAQVSVETNKSYSESKISSKKITMNFPRCSRWSFLVLLNTNISSKKITMIFFI
uniref:Uncharacterized protein n=1 Tax=Arundo donax TaxID=35708 RepID=A0A0A9HSL1_ARUDO